MGKFLKSGTPVGLDPMTIANDMAQPVIVVRDGLIKIPEIHDFKTSKDLYKWVEEVNSAWVKEDEKESMQTRIISSGGKKDQFVVIPTTIDEFMESLSAECAAMTETITDPDEVNDIIDGKIDLRPKASELEELARKGFIKKGTYSSEEDDEEEDSDETDASEDEEDPEDEDIEDDDKEDEESDPKGGKLSDEINSIITAAVKPASSAEAKIVAKVVTDILSVIKDRLK